MSTALSAIEETAGVVKSGNVAIVCASNLDLKLKRCVCVMTQSDTICIKGDNETQTAEWFASLMSVVVPARALKLGRPVMHREFFECAWDVEISPNPKLKRPPKPEDPPLSNFAIKRPEFVGPMRLCFYPHTIILAQRRAEPTNVGCPVSGFPPFKMEHFVELSRHFIPFYGFYEKYFLLKIGRGSPLGACELWASCESEEIAFDMHSKLQQIIERERDKRKIMAERCANLVYLLVCVCGVSSAHPAMFMRTMLLCQASPLQLRQLDLLTENELTQMQRGSDDSSSAIPSTPSLSLPSASLTTRHRRILLRDAKNFLLDSFDEDFILPGGDLRPRASLGSASVAHLESATARRVGSPASLCSLSGRKPSSSSLTGRPIFAGATNDTNSPCGSTASVFHPSSCRSACIEEESGIYQPMETVRRMPVTINPHSTSASGYPQQRHERDMQIYTQYQRSLRQTSPILGITTGDETEDSGGTLRLEGTVSEGHPSPKQVRTLHGISEARRNSKDMWSSDGDELSSMGGSSSIGGSSSHGMTGSMGGISANETDIRQATYTLMDPADWQNAGSTSHLVVPNSLSLSEREKYNLEEVRSYVSDSSDSCYSSMAAHSSAVNNPPRAYSFGGRTAHVKTVSTAMADSVIDSGSSLDSKPAEPVCSTSTNNNQDDPRKRAFSLGNKGLLTELRKPFRKISQHATRNRQSHASASHSGGSLGSSAASFGPTSTSSNQLSTSNEQGEYVRNRSGSFGSGRSTPYSRRGNMTDNHLTPILAKQLEEISMNSVGTSRSNVTGGKQLAARANEQAKQKFAAEVAKTLEPTISESDYVITEPSELRKKSKEVSCTKPTVDVRTSQLFETIEENASGKSSRASSSPDYEMFEAASSNNLLPTSVINSLPMSKRSSVPSLPESSKDKPAQPPARQSVQDDSHLDYACLVPVASPSRQRSRSGVLSQQQADGTPSDYTAVRPL
ncbi:hypothetical protein WR25_23052 [Diploscapter pachys]|uniref:PH domain-containing protein n=1 Tax=Diploscapter pachys TaxID=2018661 RepID=A0A2A2JD60_9BILA|nr:hypothetical protein WR25_23052 [Diploscapter pachys]